jgi:hypothetical protein
MEEWTIPKPPGASGHQLTEEEQQQWDRFLYRVFVELKGQGYSLQEAISIELCEELFRREP